MDKESINETPDYWKNFYPHESFVKFLQTVLGNLDGGSRSVWLAASYGTGKSHAVLVLQKLLTDDSTRVKEWLEEYKKLIPESVRTTLWSLREQKPLVIYDSIADGLLKPEQFLVRLQQSIIAALKERDGSIPVVGQLDEVLEKIRKVETLFFDTRDGMQEELIHLTPDIKTVNELEKRLSDDGLVSGLVHDIMLVCERMNYYPKISVDSFRNWVSDVLKTNNIPKILYIWDEFSTYVDQNSNQLTTFQEVANMAQQGQFYLLPVTHMHLESYLAAGSESARKINGRFDFCSLDMPTHTALVLAAQAIKVQSGQEGNWDRERKTLWKRVKPIVTDYLAEIDEECKSNQNAFEGVMPIHPMTAVMLKFLATMTGSNQRSMFSFLKGDKVHTEFQDFMAQGGPYENGKLYLTVDYLWSYFVERDDLGVIKDVDNIRMEFNRKSKTLDANEIRVFKAVLLYSLLDSMTQKSGTEIIQPTIKNLEQCFKGDLGIVDVRSYLEDLQTKHCLSILGDRCYIFREEANTDKIDEIKNEILNDFKTYICDEDPNDNDEPKLTKELSNKVLLRNNDKFHFIVRCSTPDKVAQTCQSTKELFGPDGNRVLVQFIVSPNWERHVQAADMAKSLARTHKDLRILFVVTPNIHFCTYDPNNWDEYAEYRARARQANDTESKTSYMHHASLILDKWKNSLFVPTQRLQIFSCSPEGVENCVEKDWTTIIPYLQDYLRSKFDYFLDNLSEYNPSAITENIKSLKDWAEAGLTKTGKGAQKAVWKSLGNKGIDATSEWFAANPNHPLTQLRDYCKKKLDNALNGSGKCSVRKILADLVKPPFGLLYVPYTAFIMGVAMHEWLDTSKRALQWTNITDSGELDVAILTEMIVTAIQDKGKTSNDDDEKFVCKISPEEKAFFEASSTMFGIEREANANLKSVLGKIADRLQQISNKAPLWVLKDYIAEREEPHIAKVIAEILDNICQAMTIAKNDQKNSQSKLIKAAGALIRKTAGIPPLIQKYVNPDVFDKAFKQHVDKAMPELRDLASKIGDQNENSQYCQTIKNRCAETSSWLWKQGDIGKELNIVFAQYQIIQLVQEFIGQSAFIPYSSAEERLKKAFFTDNKISLEVLAGDYPVISDLISRFNNADVGDSGYLDFAQALQSYKDQVKFLFFDPSFKVQIDTLKKLFVNQLETLGDGDVREIYSRLDAQAQLPDDAFRTTTSQKIDEYLKESVGSQIKALWEKKTGASTPLAWSQSHRLPFNILFDADEEASEMTSIVQNPAAYQADRLQAALQRLKEISFPNDERELQNKFLKMVVPAKYQKLGIDADKLLEYLSSNVSTNPNQWLNNPKRLSEQIEAFVRNSYQENFSSKAVNIAQSFDANQAKSMLLEFIKQYPDVGLKILEDANGR